MTAWDYTLIGLLGLAVIYFGYYVYLLVREILPTLKQVKSFQTLVQATVEQTAELTPRFQKISEQAALHGQSAQELGARAGEVVTHVRQILSLHQSAIVFLGAVRKVDWQRYFSSDTTGELSEKLQEKANWNRLLERLRELKNRVVEKTRRESKFQRIAKKALPFVFGTAAGGVIAYFSRDFFRDTDTYRSYPGRHHGTLPRLQPYRPAEPQTHSFEEEEESPGK